VQPLVCSVCAVHQPDGTTHFWWNCGWCIIRQTGYHIKVKSPDTVKGQFWLFRTSSTRGTS
jgi:hypothetical protein